MPPEFRLPWQRRQDEELSTIPGASRRSPSAAADGNGFFARLARFTIFSTASNTDGNAASVDTIMPGDSISTRVVHLSSAGRTLSPSTNNDDNSDAESVHTIRARNATSNVSRSTATYSSTTATGTSFTSANGRTEVSIQASAYSFLVPGIYQVLAACDFILIHLSARAPSSEYTFREPTSGMEEEVAALVIDNGCVLHLC